jgi:hypothetical protein
MYCNGWGHVADFLLEGTAAEIGNLQNVDEVYWLYGQFLYWLSDEVNEYGHEIKSRLKLSSLDNLKSSVNMYFRLVFNINALDCEANRLTSKGLDRKNPKLPKYRFVWNINSVLGSLKSLTLTGDLANDKILHLEFWQRKVTVLLSIYSLLRPQEIHAIVLDNYIIEEDGLWVFTLIKTDSS